MLIRKMRENECYLFPVACTRAVSNLQLKIILKWKCSPFHNLYTGLLHVVEFIRHHDANYFL